MKLNFRPVALRSPSFEGVTFVGEFIGYSRSLIYYAFPTSERRRYRPQHKKPLLGPINSFWQLHQIRNEHSNSLGKTRSRKLSRTQSYRC